MACCSGVTSGVMPVASSRTSSERDLYGLQFIMAGASLALKCCAR